MKKIFKKDSVLLGVAISIVLPLIAFGVLSVIALVLPDSFSEKYLFTRNLILLSLAVNLVAMRIYFVNWKMEKTGRAILAMVFMMMIVFFALKK